MTNKRHIEKLARKRTMEQSLTEGSIHRNIFLLGVPMILETIILNIGRVSGTYWAAQLGDEALAAITVGSTIYSVSKSLANGLSVGGLSIIARRIGAGDPLEIEHAVGQMVLISLLTSFLVGGLGFFSASLILVLLGVDNDVLPLALSYLRITFVGLFFFINLVTVNAMLRGAGEARLTMRILFIGTIVALVSEPVLIFGLGPLPAMGVAGSALASVLSFGVQLILLMVIILRGGSQIRINLRQLKPDFLLIGRIISVAFPSAMQTTLRSSSQLVILGLVAAYGTQAMAAYGMAKRLLLFITIPGIGLGNAASVLVGQNLGTHKPARAERSAWLSGVYASGYMFIMTIILFIFTRSIITLFAPALQGVGGAVSYIRIVAPSLIFSLLGVVLGRGFSGAGDTVTPMILNLFTLWIIAAPLSYALSHWLGLGMVGVWGGLAISNVANGLLFAFWFRKGLWKRKDL